MNQEALVGGESFTQLLPVRGCRGRLREEMMKMTRGRLEWRGRGQEEGEVNGGWPSMMRIEMRIGKMERWGTEEAGGVAGDALTFLPSLCQPIFRPLLPSSVRPSVLSVPRGKCQLWPPGARCSPCWSITLTACVCVCACALRGGRV